MSLKKNIFYQFAYQIIILVIPLILSKYVTSIISSDVLGVYSYSYSIASYFAIFAMLGLQKYGTRLISQSRDDAEELRIKFWSVYWLHCIFSLSTLILYAVFCLVFVNSDALIYWIQAIFLASSLFDITWLFYGLENFRSVVIKNSLVKIAEVALILLFVKGPQDLWIYSLIMAGSVFLGQIIMMPQAIKQVKPKKVSWADIKCHTKPLLILSIAVISTSVYGILDKVLLGALSPKGVSDVAIYEYSDKIIKIPLSILAAIETALLPRMSALSSKSETDEFRRKIDISVVLISCASIGAVFGVASVSNIFVKLWYAEDYSACADTILYLSPVIFGISFGDIIRSQYLIPKGKDKWFTISIIAGAVLNVALNLSLIPSLGLTGAIIGTLAAEFSVSFFQFFIARKELPILHFFLEPLPFIAIGFGMFFLNKFVESLLGISYLSLFLIILCGLVSYGALSVIYLLLFKKDVLKSIFKRT